MGDGDRIGHDRRWHAAVLAGDDEAWRAGYDAAYASVRAYIQWRCAGLADLVDDVTQEAWLTAVRRIADYQPARGPFATWVCGIAGNVVLNALRHRRRQRIRVTALVGDCPEPNSDLDPRERAERTASALAMLPEHYERALRDKYLLAMSVATMAEHRGESVKTVESLLTRARERFRQVFEQQDHDDG